MATQRDWEEIPTPSQNIKMHRHRVPRGWLVLTEHPHGIQTTFVQDERKEWIIREESFIK